MPDCQETSAIIRDGVFRALSDYENKTTAEIEGPCECSLELMDGFHYEIPKHISWKGSFEDKVAFWEAPYFEIASELFNEVRACIRKDEM